MLDRVRATLAERDLARPGEPLWVAVSGGADSMVLLHALRCLGHPCHVAHVDHGLRGDASDADRALVTAYCEQHGIPCEVLRVEVKARATETGESTQMAARSLRMEWFAQLTARGPDKIATAHHEDDVTETFFLGMIQGMGARGWASIPARHGTIIRPLIDVDKATITGYAEANGIPWREDASNGDDAYLRNRIRNELLPMLESWRPGTHRNLARNMRLFGELDALARDHGSRCLEDLVPEADGTLRIPFQRILGPAPLIVLHRLLRHKGFHPDRFDDMLAAIHAGHTGARFPGESVEVFVDRKELVVAPSAGAPGITIFHGAEAPREGALLSVQVSSPTEVDPGAGANVAWLDADRFSFPLQLRPWRPGDRMRPEGLGGSKLISDILIDAKIPRDRKDRIHVLADGDRIIWLCGMRLSEGVKATSSSATVLKFRWSGL
ncbi:MAG: tRNA lysidine(34) synthetase TilS [Flavobacteriales bacterium]|nr:tRNA lysidine(34) synthetase TilS [Flavobacteriales bacterium]